MLCFLLFLLSTGVHVLSRLFLPRRGLCSAHKHHCLQALLTASQESLWSTGSALTALPRRPIHPHRLGSTHTLSVSQRHSQWHSKGTSGFSGELDQIPTSHLVTHIYYAAIRRHLCFADDKVSSHYSGYSSTWYPSTYLVKLNPSQRACHVHVLQNPRGTIVFGA